MVKRDAEERLLNLIIALTHARTRMTRDEIRSTVEGYEPEDASLDEAGQRRAKAAFERMFERDKDDLRRMGIPLQTVVDVAHGDDIGYRISAVDTALPAVEFTAAERAVIAIAADYWRDATLGADARQALTKVSSRSEAGPSEPMPLAGRATHAASVTADLAEAIQDRQAVAFDYSSASSGDARREVQPWAVVLRGGVEYLIAHDAQRDEPRTFRIGRIHGGITRVGEGHAYVIPDRPAARGFAAPTESSTGVVALRPETGHTLRRRGRATGTDGDWDLVEVEYAHADALRDEVLALGGTARIVSPASVAEAVADHARRALEVTGG